MQRATVKVMRPVKLHNNFTFIGIRETTLFERVIERLHNSGLCMHAVLACACMCVPATHPLTRTDREAHHIERRTVSFALLVFVLSSVLHVVDSVGVEGIASANSPLADVNP